MSDRNMAGDTAGRPRGFETTAQGCETRSEPRPRDASSTTPAGETGYAATLQKLSDGYVSVRGLLADATLTLERIANGQDTDAEGLAHLRDRLRRELRSPGVTARDRVAELEQQLASFERGAVRQSRNAARDLGDERRRADHWRRQYEALVHRVQEVVAGEAIAQAEASEPEPRRTGEGSMHFALGDTAGETMGVLQGVEASKFFEGSQRTHPAT